MIQFSPLLALPLLLLFSWCPPPLCAAECTKITVYYIERPPYLITTASGVKGLTGNPTEWAFKTAGIPFQWQELPTARQLQLIKDNSGCDCLVNYFKTAERASYGKYSETLYQDQPHIALARADNTKLKSGGTVDSLLATPGITVEVKKDWSYGAFLDGKLKEHHPQLDETMGDNSQLLKKIAAGRADFFFTTPAEADMVIAASGFAKEDFTYISFTDVPAGEKRYLLCSRQVDDAIIEKLNTALERFERK